MPTMTCETPKKPLSCAQMLSQAIDAHHQLMAGVTRVTVTHGESTVTYQQKNAAGLLQYIKNLHMACGNNISAAVIGMPSRRSPGVAVFGRTSFLEKDCCGCNTPVPVKTCDEGCNECD